MKKLLYFAITMFVSVAFFTSCKNDIAENVAPDTSVSGKFDNSMLSDPTITSDYVVKEGAVHFKDVEAYRKVASDLTAFSLRLKKDYPQFE